ncbi:MAG: PP2C family protein-serine/threonine phosphatase [Terracidiphilus sp.]
MRKTISGLAALAVCFTFQAVAQQQPQQPHPHGGGPPPLVKLLAPHGNHPQPASADAPKTPPLVLDATGLGSPVVLDKGWRVGISANPDVAKPDFDDSTWAVRDATDAFPEVPDEDHLVDDAAGEHKSPNTAKKPADEDDDPDTNDNLRPPSGHHHIFAWFRIHVKLAPGHAPLALLIELPVSQNTSMNNISSSGAGVDVFANGVLVHPEGPHSDNPEHYQAISRIYNLNVPSSETDLVLVLRTMSSPFGYASYTYFFNGRKLQLGNREDLDHRLEIWRTHTLFERLPRTVNSILLLVLSLFLLALYFTQKGHPEYLWLALHEFVQAPLGFIELAGSSARIDTLWYWATVSQLVMVSAYLYFEFLIAFLALRKRWYIHALRWTAPLLAGFGPSLLLAGHSDWAGLALAAVGIFSAFWLFGWLIFIFLTLISATVRRNFEAGLLLIPLILDMIGIAEPVVTGSMNGMTGRSYHSPLTIAAGPIPIHFAAIADFIGILAIILIIFVRFLRIQRDQQRVSSELEAARSVQELMIPHEQLLTPGFEVDSVYNPATEVGGDFFHVQPTSDGGLLIVIGDVAGHGLKAAMNVSMLMGAMRRTSEHSPAKILESLNRVLTGSESFTTCQAAFFSANGEVVLSNAGHLPPYLNSQEVNIPGGLPLGVLNENTYDEIHLYLHPGDRLLMMSDGVVEARHPNGELFGFDRVRNLSNQTAFYIADSAKIFGQEDDITVLTVRRLAQAMAA